MNTRRPARFALSLLRACAAQATLTLACQGALAAGIGAEVEPPAAGPTPAAQLVAQSLRETVAPQVGEVRAQPRLGMHVVVRLAVVDVVSHPDSGDVDLSPRSRLLSRHIARKPLAVGVTWRF
jgi:hypothetical protein